LQVQCFSSDENYTDISLMKKKAVMAVDYRKLTCVLNRISNKRF